MKKYNIGDKLAILVLDTLEALSPITIYHHRYQVYGCFSAQDFAWIKLRDIHSLRKLIGDIVEFYCVLLASSTIP